MDGPGRQVDDRPDEVSGAEDRLELLDT